MVIATGVEFRRARSRPGRLSLRLALRLAFRLAFRLALRLALRLRCPGEAKRSIVWFVLNLRRNGDVVPGATRKLRNSQQLWRHLALLAVCFTEVRGCLGFWCIPVHPAIIDSVGRSAVSVMGFVAWRDEKT